MVVSDRLLLALKSLKGQRRTVPVDRATTSSEQRNSEKIPTIPYVDFVKRQFHNELDELDKKVLNAEIKRLSLPSKDYSQLLSMLSSTVVTKHCKLIPVGSSVNGLSNNRSDLDLVFLPSDPAKRNQFQKDFHGNIDFKTHFMNTLMELIARSLTSEGVTITSKDMLPRLRVPLMSMRFSNGTSVDIQFPENFNAIRNTNMIRTYVQVDPRFALLFHWVRTTLDVLEVKNSKNSLLSSYHLLLLTIHFLQSEQCLSPWTVLPVLGKTHPHVVGQQLPIDDVVKMLTNPPTAIDWKSHNKMPLSELIVRFVDYYSTFDVAGSAIFIEKGLATRRKQAASGDVRLQLVDPYTPYTVCRSQYAARALTDAMIFLRKKMKSGQMLDSFPDFPEAELFKLDTKWASWRQQLNDKRTGAA